MVLGKFTIKTQNNASQNDRPFKILCGITTYTVYSLYLCIVS